MKDSTRDKLGTAAGVALLMLFILGAGWLMSRPAPEASAVTLPPAADSTVVSTDSVGPQDISKKLRKSRREAAPKPKPRDIHNIPIPQHEPSKK